MEDDPNKNLGEKHNWPGEKFLAEKS